METFLSEMSALNAECHLELNVRGRKMKPNTEWTFKDNLPKSAHEPRLWQGFIFD